MESETSLYKNSARPQKISLAPIPGFPELDISENIVMSNVQNKIKRIYQKYGYVPLDTRLVETDTVLNQKGIDSKELFSLNWLSKGVEYEVSETRRKLALRFDLTVPLARYIGQNKNKISFPFKRYQIQKVYRAEGHKVAQGRFNEFYQSDIDVIGYQTLDLSYDSEFPALVYEIFKNILNIEKFVMRISNRKLLEGLFEENEVRKVTKIKRAVKIIDDIEKVDAAVTLERLNEVGMTKECAEKLLEFFNTLYQKMPLDAIKFLKEQEFKNKKIRVGISELETVVNGIIANNVSQDYFRVDARIARGLDYYTGTVYETNLLDHLELGSVCSGGRYNDLVSTLTGDAGDNYPGVGLSIGLSRLIPTLIKFNYLLANKNTNCDILVTCQDKKFINKYQEVGALLRDFGYNVDIYLNKSVKLPKQLDYANKKGFNYVIIANKIELDQNMVIVRNMESANQEVIDISKLTDYFENKIDKNI